MNKNLLHFLLGLILGAAWGFFWDLVDAGYLWAWWPVVILTIVLPISSLFSREENSYRLYRLLGILLGAILSGFYYYNFLWY
jgi:hypothetical protein